MANRLKLEKLLVHETKGAGGVEYGLLIAGIALGLMGAIFALGSQLTAVAACLGG
jgi:Flp pilus assembly pilin Flp